MSPNISTFVPGRPTTLLAALRNVAHAILLVSIVGASSVANALEAPICKPPLTISNVRFSETHPETLIRTWSATVSADASGCASSTGRFEMMFNRQKENAPELDFTEAFAWRLGPIDVSVDFWADEAVEGYWPTAISECPCRQR